MEVVADGNDRKQDDEERDQRQPTFEVWNSGALAAVPLEPECPETAEDKGNPDKIEQQFQINSLLPRRQGLKQSRNVVFCAHILCRAASFAMESSMDSAIDSADS